MEEYDDRRDDNRRMAKIADVAFHLPPRTSEEKIASATGDNGQVAFRQRKSGRKKRQAQIYAADISELEPLIFRYPDLNEEQHTRLKIMIQDEIKRQMHTFQKKLERQIANSQSMRIFDAEANSIRTRTALLVYRRRNIDLRTIEKEAYRKFTGQISLIGKLFAPDPNDALDFNALDAKGKWERIFKDKHYRAFYHDPHAKKVAHKNPIPSDGGPQVDIGHSFRVNLPENKLDIRSLKASAAAGRAKKAATTLTSAELLRLSYKIPTVPKRKKRTFWQKVVVEKSIATKAKTELPVRKRYLSDRAVDVPALSGDTISEFYSKFDGKNTVVHAKKIARKMKNARHQKFGAMNPEYTLLYPEENGSLIMNTNEHVAFMSPDPIATPFEPVNLIDNHTRLTPAMSVTTFTNAKTASLQVIAKNMHDLSKNNEDCNEGSSNYDEATVVKERSGKQQKIKALSPEEVSVKINMDEMWDKFHRLLSLSYKTTTHHKAYALSRRMSLGKISNPFFQVRIKDYSILPERGEYPKCQLKLAGATVEEIHNFQRHVINSVLENVDDFVVDAHPHAVQATLHALITASNSSVKKARPGVEQKIVPLKPTVLGRFRDGMASFNLGPLKQIEVLCKYSSAKWFPWADEASNHWTTAGAILHKLKRAAEDYLGLLSTLPDNSKKNKLVVEAQNIVLYLHKRKCDALMYFFVLCLSDVIPAWILHIEVKKVMEILDAVNAFTDDGQITSAKREYVSKILSESFN
jgi:hypothetical protein